MNIRYELIRLLAGNTPVVLNCFVRGGVWVRDPSKVLFYGNHVDGRKPSEDQWAVTMDDERRLSPNAQDMARP